MTAPHFEQFVPRDLIGPDQKCWQAVTLSLESPWYLLVYEAACDDRKVTQTTLVAWESTLFEILTSIPEGACMAIARLERHRDKVARWDMKWIQRIWASAGDECAERGLFLFQLEGDPQLRNAHLHSVPHRTGRKLLFGSPPSSSSLKDAPANA